MIKSANSSTQSELNDPVKTKITQDIGIRQIF